MFTRFSWLVLLTAIGLSLCLPEWSLAQEASPEAPAAAAAAEAEAEAAPKFALLGDVNALWTCIAAFLVFWMQAGFALVETGFTRAKSAGNICMKNLMDFCIGTLTFWALGFGLMFGMNSSGFIGTSDFLYEGTDTFSWAFLIFQTVFCATAATIVSGAMAERTKFSSYLIYSVALTAVVYPIFGSWAWNGLMLVEGSKGWLEEKGFHDFAGSTVVHSIGGWAALAGAIIVGPRIGKFVKGKVMPIPGHSLVLGCIGVFILWLGWFGFNPGSTTAIDTAVSFAYIAVTTNAAAAAGAIMAMITSWAVFKKPDISFTLNGALAGLVAITAGCDCVSVPFAILIGACAGVIVVFSCLCFDKLRVDDPVGAVSVHGVCGAWGTLSVGLFMLKDENFGGGLFTGGGATQLVSQLWGVGAAFLWSFCVSGMIFLAIKYTVGLRVSEQEELDGLDIHEHGVYAYPPQFVIDNPIGSPLKGHGHAVSAPMTATEPVLATES